MASAVQPREVGSAMPDTSQDESSTAATPGAGVVTETRTDSADIDTASDSADSALDSRVVTASDPATTGTPPREEGESPVDETAEDAATGEPDSANDVAAPAELNHADTEAASEPGATAPGTEPPAVPSTEPEARETSELTQRVPATLDQVESFPDFLMYLRRVEGDLKPVALAKGSSARAALTKPVALDDFENLIAEISARDPKLGTASALMLTAEKSNLGATARKNVAALAARLLGTHPAFAADSAFGNRLGRLAAGDLDDEALARSIVRMQNLLTADFDGKAAMKAPAVQSLADNAAQTLVLIAASAAGWSLDDYIDAFADTIWGVTDADGESASAREKIALLPKSARKAVAHIVSAMRARSAAIEAERDRVTHRLDTTLAATERMTAELATARAHAAELEAETAGVRAELQRETEARRSERMGATSDFETMRIDTAQVIAKQIESLEDALDALQHGQPQVTEEFVRRSINNLRRSLTTLQPPAIKDARGEVP
ncbi:hypothetical protein [Nocardia cyriacigeorgica]|uniref:hypothetical protein n=2 Tax=Nocardia cyriacigeorgica TaxID=135487 RepID=UPI002455312B|nr:hypothetical protein [Nocardia cyriacigeorgica]